MNLLFVFPDQYRAQAIGCLDADPVVTPNLDRFAAESLSLTNAVSTHPVCSPYRAMLFTGNYPHRNRVLGNCNSDTVDYGNYLQESDCCITDALHDSGYNVGYIGKLHLDPPREPYDYTEGRRGDGAAWDAFTPPGPRRHGVDFWYSYGCYDNHLDPHYWTGDGPVEDRIDPHQWSVEHETGVACDFIRNRDPQKPFALFVSHNPPHPPFPMVPDRYREPYRDATPRDLLNRPNVRLEGQGAAAEQHVVDYFAAITGVDDQFRRLLACLDEEEVAEDTVVVFTSDHGEMMGSHGMMAKRIYYDESFRVPFYIRWPGHVAPGEDDLLIGAPDLYPTLLGLLDLSDLVPEVQGLDLSGALLGGSDRRPDSALYVATDPERPEGGRRGLRTHGHTYVVERTRDGDETRVLFDNVADPYQMTNIHDPGSAVVRDLDNRLTERLSKIDDPWVSRVG